ncbi:MAG: DUF1801 domain-containing protein [candidate division Zixibacteria bacterium]|nr:DUF1801 domain-containing protein [candidate division Zixibacteria bacterium]
MNPAKTVEEYLAKLPQVQRAVLEPLRRAIRAAAPQAVEVISYQIPTYKLNGPLVHFMAAKHHCSFICVDKSVPKQFAKELAGYKVSGTTIQFTPENPPAATLVKKIVKMRIKQNEGKR